MPTIVTELDMLNLVFGLQTALENRNICWSFNEYLSHEALILIHTCNASVAS